ncbi:MAG: flagellar hook-associated protein FlgK [Bradyrhizobium sp.]
MLTNAFNTANAGLRALQVAIGTVSQNVANGGAAGYARREVSTVASAGENSGVATVRLDRIFDEMALKQLRLETARAASAAVKADVLAKVDGLFGKPGDATAFDARLNRFAQALQGLAANPSSVAMRGTALDAAASAADKIRGVAGAVQDLRGGIEKRLASDVSGANDLLASIARLNLKITNTGDDGARAALMDQRDQKILQLSSYLEIRQGGQRDGSLTLMSSSGGVLVDHGTAATLAYAVGPGAGAPADPSTQSVAKVTAVLPSGGTVELTPSALSAGRIAAGLELRDQVLTQTLRRLDDLALGMARAFTDKTVAAKPDKAGGFELPVNELANLKAGNTITITIGTGETVRNVILVASDLPPRAVDASQTVDAAASAQTFTIPPSPATAQSLATAITAALATVIPGLTATASASGGVTIAGAGLQGVSAVMTQPRSAADIAGGNVYMPLFVDGGGNGLVTGSLDRGSQREGLAGRLAVNPALTGDPSRLVNAGGPAGGTASSRAQFLSDMLTSGKQAFPSASGIAGRVPYSTTVMGFARDIVAAEGARAAAAKSRSDEQSAAHASAQAWFANGASVNIDQEMSRLLTLQTAYAANARVLTAVREMLDLLLRA